MTTVARVITMRKLDTQLVLQIEDSTDEIECRYWLGPQEEPDEDILCVCFRVLSPSYVQQTD